MAASDLTIEHDSDAIVGRDLDGLDHVVTVATKCGLICVQDAAIARIYSLRCALELAHQIIEQVLTEQRRQYVGPFGGEG